MTDYEKLNQLHDLRDDLRQILGSKHHPDRALRLLGRASMTTAADMPHRRRAMAELQRAYAFDRARTSIQEAIRSLTDAIEGGTATKARKTKKKATAAKEPATIDATGGQGDA